MEKPENSLLEERYLSLAAAVYYAVMFAGVVIGLYGLFSLLWLATSAVERVSPVTGSLL